MELLVQHRQSMIFNAALRTPNLVETLTWNTIEKHIHLSNGWCVGDSHTTFRTNELCSRTKAQK